MTYSFQKSKRYSVYIIQNEKDIQKGYLD